VERFEEAIEVLSPDPQNKSHKYPIKKLTNVPAGEGQYRLRSGRFRFRYDVAGCGARTHIEGASPGSSICAARMN
jgi:hypothetical protein